MTPASRRALTIFGWLFVASGIAYLLVGARGLVDGTEAQVALVLIGLVAITTGTGLLRWLARRRPDA